MRLYYVSEERVRGEWVPVGPFTGDLWMFRYFLGKVGNNPDERIRRVEVEEFRRIGEILGIPWVAKWVESV